MSTEKTIKNQAKKSLEGNWTIAISALFFVCAIAVLIIAGSSILTESFNLHSVSDLENLDDGSAFLYGIITLIGNLAVCAVSPVINGVVKIFTNISMHGKTEIGDIFYYFKNAGDYFRSIFVNYVVYFCFSFIGGILDIYGFVTAKIGVSLQNGVKFDILTALLILALIASIIIKIIVYIIFVHYTLIFHSMFDSFNFTMSIKFAIRHFGATIKLLFSFLGWILLCFFVVPAIYVVPYFISSAAVSTKWLYALDKDRGLL